MRFAEHRRETQKTGGGPPPAPLSQTVADIVDLYKGCSSFVGVSGGIETPISKHTGVLFYRPLFEMLVNAYVHNHQEKMLFIGKHLNHFQDNH